MAGPSRFLIVAVATAAGLWLAASAIGVSSAMLQSASVVLGFAGILVASIVEFVLKRREPAKPAAPAAKASAEEG
jgi:hypothetical protein